MAGEHIIGGAIEVSGTDSQCFSSDGIVIGDIEQLMRDIGMGFELAELKQYFLTIVPKGVQTAENSVIQDPAGSAIGDVRKPIDTPAGGASGAIYKAFPDLEPIPKIAMGDSIFNTSTGPGRRVLHTHAPNLRSLAVSPAIHDNREQVLTILANTYYKAYLCCYEAGKSKKRDMDYLDEIALVPVSGSIYAGEFIDSSIQHLHPSYSVCAIMIAQGSLLKNNVPLITSSLFYYTGLSNAAYKAAVAVMKGIIGGL